MVLDSACTPLTRSWCLFEVLQTFEIQKGRPGFDFLFGSASGVLNDGAADVSLALLMARKISTIDLRHAGASNADDKQMIEDLVRQTGGFSIFNRFVRGKMHATLRLMQGNVEDLFKELEGSLLASEEAEELAAAAGSFGSSCQATLPTLLSHGQAQGKALAADPALLPKPWHPDMAAASAASSVAGQSDRRDAEELDAVV
jgi:hypothetical protein